MKNTPERRDSMNDDPYDYLDADYEEYLKREESNKRQAFYIAFLLLTGIKEKAVSIDRRNFSNISGSGVTVEDNHENKKTIIANAFTILC